MSQSPLHRAALELASRGIPVFPCLPGSKKPATETGFHEATTDPRQVDAWWSENPEYNLAFPPDAVGLCVVDLDGGQVGEDSWSDLQIEHGQADPTRELRTPSGGRHMHFKGRLPPSVNKLGNKVDTRGTGSYVLLPPSVVDERGEANPDKWGSYTYLTDTAPATVPEWITPALERGKAKAKAAADVSLDRPANIARAVSYLKSRPEVFQGEGADAKTYEIACDVLNLGISAGVAFDLMLEHYKCSPQDDRYQDFLERKITNAQAYCQNEPGSWAVAPAQEVFGDALGKLTFEDEPVRRSRFEALTLEEIAALPPPEWLIPGMLPAKGLSLLYGPPGSYKSFVALQLGLGLAVAGKSVVYIGAEGGRGLELRAAAWKLAHGHTGKVVPLRIVPNMPWASDGSMIEEFIEVTRKHKPELIVIDTAARMMVGLNENDARDMGLFVAAMDTIKEALGCAVLAIHHTGKDDARGARGSIALTAAVDAAFEVKADKETKLLAVYCRRQKDAEEREEPWTYEGRAVASSLVFEEIKFHEYMRLTKPDDGMSTKIVGEALAGMNARGEAGGVTTHILAQHLAQSSGLADDQPDLTTSRLEKALSTRAKGPLEAYAIAGPGGLRWYLPG